MSNRGEVTNTTDQDPMLTLALLMGGGGSGIEAMEARGQSELVASEQIPSNLAHGLTEDMLIAMGFKLGTPTPGDPMFRSATLPKGWSKRRTDHSMWSEIVDEKCRKRLAIFYKAAFYDRRASMSAVRRFEIISVYPETDKGQIQVFIADAGVNVKRIGSYKQGSRSAADEVRADADAWLRENRPDHENVMAYWDKD